MPKTATTANRVAIHTADKINRGIERDTECRLRYYAENPDEIDGRLAELDREWDIERTLEANAAGISVASVLLGMLVSRKWLVMPGIIGGFLLQHAIQGWCPPVPVFRRMGVRTQTEIEKERYALKALRGDFSGIGASGNNSRSLPQQVMDSINHH